MKITAKVLQSALYWLTLFKDTHEHRTRNVSIRQEMSLHSVLEIELIDVWGIDFIGPFLPSVGKLYILLAVDYVFKWVKVVTLASNDAKSVLKFLHKNIFTRFGTSKAIISDEGSHFDCKLMANALRRYGVKHRIVTAYHLQTNGQAEISNREIKKILKKLVNPFKLVCGKPCHLPIELEHKAFWAIKRLNMI
ncbi:Transposon Ty3-I Gag-Pol polyprotein [Gossypium australe]|uniref:Transposon Ty3-I Gag-Pol polyprotein n=1 Tax=Gossypium australe TaxID=47621 RepID=A0A5B6VBF8_9ROSI|nr:Transposon Ty3-I Gag-Pol polyprotein [Gossypium australe]